MDAYDLFKRLGSGAKFDFKRFRDDAVRLKMVKPRPVKKKKSKEIHSLRKDTSRDAQQTKTGGKKNKESSENEGSSSSEDDENEEESGDENSSAESDSDQSESEARQSESDEELQILGNITAKGHNSADLRMERKLRKKKMKLNSEEKMAALKQEEINRLRNKSRIHMHGTDLPDPMESFDKLATEYKFLPQLVKNIKTVGYNKPTPIQIQAIPVMLNRREVMACAPTGSGKTAAFIIPILHHLREPRNEGIRALVLAPTRELAKQTYREFQRLSEGIGFRILYIDKVPKDIDTFKKALLRKDILVSTPNRLVYMVKQSPPLVSLTSVHWLVVDESDKLFEEGKSGFRDQLAAIYNACDGPGVKKAMFSATFAYDVEEWCKLNLDNVIQVYVGAKNSATRSVKQSLLFVGSETGKLLAMRDIIRKGINPPVLVFVQSKERAKELFHELIYDGMNVDVIHAERTQLQRDNVVRSFREGKIWFLICTELMGRGIDFKGVNLVINYDFPNSAVSYIHRIGRTGRAGHRGQAITFFTEDDAVNLRSIANVMRSSGCPVPNYMLKINRPSKKERKKLTKHVPQRERISTRPYEEIEAEEVRREIRKRRRNQLKAKSRKQSGTQQKTDSSSVQSNGNFPKGKRKTTGDSEVPVRKKKVKQT